MHENSSYRKGARVRHKISGLVGEVIETRALDIFNKPGVMVSCKREEYNVPSFYIWALDEIEEITEKEK
jgi:hypothetical protein